MTIPTARANVLLGTTYSAFATYRDPRKAGESRQVATARASNEIAVAATSSLIGTAVTVASTTALAGSLAPGIRTAIGFGVGFLATLTPG